MADGHQLDPLIPYEMPGYFVDRFAFALARSRIPWSRGVQVPPRVPALSHADRVARFRDFLQPCESLGGWRADPTEPPVLSGFYVELLACWKEFVDESGLPSMLAKIRDAREGTWLDVFNSSVFYPGRPTIPGATFFDLIDSDDRAQATSMFGPQCAVDFYCFVQQVHESIHGCQVGEPLMNELVQAAHWIRFLDRFPDLWVLQRNSATGACAVRELMAVRRVPGLFEASVSSGLDTGVLVDCITEPGTYFRTCLIAASFDQGRLRYARYLEEATRLLAP